MKSKSEKRNNMVIGNPIKQSKSPVLHGQIYKILKINAETFAFSDSKIEKLISKIKNESVGLTAVTMPFKKEVMKFLTRIDSTAKKVDAVNTIINKKGKLFGYNTDVDGIRFALRNTLLKNKKILIVGAGGAAKAAAFVIKENGGEILYLNRTKEKALEMQKNFGGRVVKPEELKANDIDVIINATPLGMFPKISKLSVPDKLIGKHQTIFDLVYNPRETKLLKVAKSKHASIISGIDMFVAQGVRQIELWTGKDILNTKLVSRLKKELNN